MPSSSPFAASKPAETALAVSGQQGSAAGSARKGRQPTDDEVRRKLERDGHDDALEGVEVVGVAHALVQERDVDRAVSRVHSSALARTFKKRERFADAQAATRTRASRLQRAVVASRVEPVAVAVQRDVQDVGVVLERPLRAVACAKADAQTESEWGKGEAEGGGIAPWWTSQSRMRMRFILMSRPLTSFCVPEPYTVRSHLAATATLLKKQNPIASSGSAW